MWELSNKGIEGYFFLDNRPVDLSLLDGWSPERVLFSKFGERLVLPLEICRKGEDYSLKVDDREYEIRNPRGGSFDVEIFPVISKERDGFFLKGFRIMGRDLVEFLQSMIIEHLSLLRNFEIWGRDWQNKKILLNGLKIRKFRRGSLREAFIEVRKKISLEKLSPWEPKVKDPRKELKKELLEVFSKYPSLIHSLKMEGEEYSLRYFKILKEVENWEEAVKVSRAAKLKKWELVARHSINHVIMAFYSFYSLPFAEDCSLERIWVKDPPEDILEMVKERLKNCSCDELCLGCCFNPSCIEENRYLDRVIGYKAIR